MVQRPSRCTTIEPANLWVGGKPSSGLTPSEDPTDPWELCPVWAHLPAGLVTTGGTI